MNHLTSRARTITVPTAAGKTPTEVDRKALALEILPQVHAPQHDRSNPTPSKQFDPSCDPSPPGWAGFADLLRVEFIEWTQAVRFTIFFLRAEVVEWIAAIGSFAKSLRTSTVPVQLNSHGGAF
ncbi:hypothetical protein [Corynebacterium suedekumii]|uniref:Uncharacterized protein n=1 Tax=Corynebacterium suedekumii TaxID=3049801 RepID=A0ABY8VHY1_9CORY|nr:hypothetical protein [Corynebacterium suedekumii]WIM69118.1 hypothetical protein QP029_07355 [Corynebacterium suedekumii]